MLGRRFLLPNQRWSITSASGVLVPQEADAVTRPSPRRCSFTANIILLAAPLCFLLARRSDRAYCHPSTFEFSVTRCWRVANERFLRLFRQHRVPCAYSLLGVPAYLRNNAYFSKSEPFGLGSTATKAWSEVHPGSPDRTAAVGVPPLSWHLS